MGMVPLATNWTPINSTPTLSGRTEPCAPIADIGHHHTKIIMDKRSNVLLHLCLRWQQPACLLETMNFSNDSPKWYAFLVPSNWDHCWFQSKLILSLASWIRALVPNVAISSQFGVCERESWCQVLEGFIRLTMVAKNWKSSSNLIRIIPYELFSYSRLEDNFHENYTDKIWTHRKYDDHLAIN